jgi:hypothetical protein
MVNEGLHRQHLIYLQRELVSAYTLKEFPSLQMLWWNMTGSSSVGLASAESHSAAPASSKSSTAATAASKPAAKSSPGAPTSAAAAIPAAETTAAATETPTAAAKTTTAVTSSPAAAAESAAGPISPAAKHRVEAGSSLGRWRPVFIVPAAAESSALESTRRPLGLKTAEADGIHAVATGVELAKLAHHLYEE